MIIADKAGVLLPESWLAENDLARPEAFAAALMQSAKSPQDQGDPVPIMTAVVLSMFLLTMAGCALSSPPSPARQETGKKDSTVKPANHDEEKSMNEESRNAIMNR